MLVIKPAFNMVSDPVSAVECRRRLLQVAMVTTIAVAIAICLAAPTLAAYPGYFGYVNSVPYPYQHLGPHYPFTVPASTTPLIYPQQAPPLFTPPLPQPLSPIATVPAQQPTQIYSPPDVYRGFAYETTYSDGGVSRVVFVRGPDARALLEQSIRSFSFTSFPVSPLPVTKLSSVQQSNTTKPSTETKEAEPKSLTLDVKAEEKTENNAGDSKPDVLSTTTAPVILPIPHSTVTPFIGPHSPGAFFYSVQVRPPEIGNSLTPALPYFAQSYFNPSADFFRRISIPPLFPGSEAAKSENNEASSNSSDEVSKNSSDDASLLDGSGLFSNSEDESVTSSNDISSTSSVVSSSSNDETTSPETETPAVTDSLANNSSNVSEENSDTNEESNDSNTESSVSSESSSSDISSDNSSSDFDITGETSNSADEVTTTSNNEPDSNSSSPTAEDHPSIDTASGNETSSTDESSDSNNDSTEVPTTVATE